MFNTTRLLHLLIALTWVGISSSAVLACQCVETGTPVCAAYWRSEAVFVGQLRDITPPDPKSTNDLPTATLHFIVEQPFRGITTATVDIGTLSGTSCDMEFVKGKHYLIYAHRNTETNQLFAGPCSRTSESRYADEDLKWIRSLMQEGVAESITGRVSRGKYDPMPGVKIEVRNENKKFEAVTDEKGNYSVSVAGASTYTVRLLVPDSVLVATNREVLTAEEPTDTLTTIEYKVELGKSQCNYEEFDLFHIDLHATAEVSGTVVTSSGRPVNKGLVYLIKAEDHDKSRFKRTEANGSFKFEDIAAGEYFLALNPRNEAPGEDDPPYPRTFYPNASDASGAIRIAVSEDAKLENLTLRVGPAWAARTVSGRVVWQKGGELTYVHVSLYDGDRYIRSINVDKRGRFSFKVYGDFKYAIEAKVWEAPFGKSERVVITDKSTNLMLVLKPD